jgi:glycosyltransferase involved in cell wall biosynthesis
LRDALESILDQSLRPSEFEILVVDNSSTDQTPEVVEELNTDSGQIRYLFAPEPGLHVGRHLGAREAKANILVYADDDIEAFPTWLEGIAKAFEDKDVMLVGGKNLPKFESEPPDWIMEMWLQSKYPEGKVLGYLSILDFGDSIKEINPYYVFGCNFSIRKSVLLEAGGFHPDAMPQELIKYRGDGESYVSRYILEHGYKTLYHPKASVYHFVPKTRLTEDYFYQRAFNQGISDSFTQLRKNGQPDKIITTFLQKLNWRLPLHMAKLFLRHGINIKSIMDNERFNTRFSKANRQGYLYHQNEVRNDFELLKWVLRENYLGENGKLPE